MKKIQNMLTCNLNGKIKLGAKALNPSFQIQIWPLNTQFLFSQYIAPGTQRLTWTGF